MLDPTRNVPGGNLQHERGRTSVRSFAFTFVARRFGYCFTLPDSNSASAHATTRVAHLVSKKRGSILPALKPQRPAPSTHQKSPRRVARRALPLGLQSDAHYEDLGRDVPRRRGLRGIHLRGTPHPMRNPTKDLSRLVEELVEHPKQGVVVGRSEDLSGQRPPGRHGQRGHGTQQRLRHEAAAGFQEVA